MTDVKQNGITGSESHPITQNGGARRIPYPAIERHGIIGDRRTAALVAADGTLDWMCLPHFDSAIVFGALLDWARGGHWRLGPNLMAEGAQNYLTESMALQTEWNMDQGSLVLSDSMLWPENERPPEQRDSRVVVRRLRCTRGEVHCVFAMEPRNEFAPDVPTIDEYSSGFTITLGDLSLRLWSNRPLESQNGRIHSEFDLSEGEEVWAVLELGAAGQSWSAESVRAAFDASVQYWRAWVKNLDHAGYGDTEIRRGAMAVHLLTYAPEGSVVAAATTSLPERIGGEWNADYRLCWVRDASLSVGMLAQLGILEETEQYLQWLAGRRSRFGQPLQVLYGVRGEKRKKQYKLDRASGYRDSYPARAGNHAYKQHQLGSYGYLADCAWIYLQAGGRWRDEYWDLIRKLAHYTVKHWQDPENGIWELPEEQQFVNSKVLCWVMLDRAVKIAGKVNTDIRHIRMAGRSRKDPSGGHGPRLERTAAILPPAL